MLYVGATLMIGASIYGFVDYKKTSHQKEFTSMYEEEKKTNPVVSTGDWIPEPVVPKKEIPGRNKKTILKKKNTGNSEKEAIIALQPIPGDEKIAPTTTEIEKPFVEVKTSNDSDVERKVTKKKKLNHKIFSRAPLREREEISLTELPKETVKKFEKKER